MPQINGYCVCIWGDALIASYSGWVVTCKFIDKVNIKGHVTRAKPEA